jgi:transposase
LLPSKAKTGRSRADDRCIINGILYVLITGCRWMNMLKRYGRYSTAFWGRLRSG